MPRKANLLVREGRKAAGLDSTQSNSKMAELPKDENPHGGIGLFIFRGGFDLF